ncbi:hypothetical protein EGJ44_20795 [Ectopseudomonas oleovorans]|uniref:Uncharacterized protein n=2 Tax=Ectopseudomonas oleovorans TaxID=301 RepID=A0A427H8G8_ECTOL|nr:hypothetical protein EGJ44_20795 [Pseudomonas oleovorans]
MRRRGVLVPGGRGVWQWERRGKPAGQVLFEVVAADRLRLRYRITTDDGEELKDYRVTIARTPCHLGGTRAWFLCPCCNRRVARLYLRGLFACRHCHRLSYTSQQAGKADSALDRSLALRHTVGANEGPLTMGADWIARPKGMHRQTFARKLGQIKQADARFMEALKVAARL